MLDYVDNIDNIEDIEEVDDIDDVDYVDDVNVINVAKVTIVCQESRIFDNLIPANGPVRSENKRKEYESGNQIQTRLYFINSFRFTIHISLVL